LPKTTELSHSECGKCHKGFENTKINIYNLPFPHQKHIARILNCNVCHASGEEHGKILKTRVECLSCHHKTASKCIDCHETQAKFIQGESLGKKDPQPDVMADGVKCIECHTTISQGHSPAEVKKTCVQCHEARYEEMTDEWQKETSEMMKRVRLSLETLRLQKKMAPDLEKRKIEALTKEVENLLRAVDEDKSRGAHNFFYARKLAAEGEQKVLSAQRSLSK
jgi:hypothetical protein